MDNNYLVLILIAIAIAIVVQMILNYLSSRRSITESLSERPRIRVKVTCVNGDFNYEREFIEGDFVGKIEGKCDKCGGLLIISAIYAEKPLTPIKRSEEHLKHRSKISQ